MITPCFPGAHQPFEKLFSFPRTRNPMSLPPDAAKRPAPLFSNSRNFPHEKKSLRRSSRAYYPAINKLRAKTPAAAFLAAISGNKIQRCAVRLKKRKVFSSPVPQHTLRCCSPQINPFYTLLKKRVKPRHKKPCAMAVPQTLCLCVAARGNKYKLHAA